MEEMGNESPESDNNGDISKALHGFLAISDDESDEFSPEFTFNEEMVEEVMQELWKEISCSTLTNPTSPPANLPSSLSTSEITASFFNGKNESCGPSVSDSAWTVMAGVEMGGGGGGAERACLVGPTGYFARCGKDESPVAGSWSWVLENGCYGMEVGEASGERLMDGCDGVEFDDDQWLGRVLSLRPDPLEVNEQK